MQLSYLVANIVKLLIMSNFFFSYDVFKRCLMLMHQNEYLWSKGLKQPEKDPNTDPFHMYLEITISAANVFMKMFKYI